MWYFKRGERKRHMKRFIQTDLSHDNMFFFHFVIFLTISNERRIKIQCALNICLIIHAIFYLIETHASYSSFHPQFHVIWLCARELYPDFMLKEFCGVIILHMIPAHYKFWEIAIEGRIKVKHTGTQNHFQIIAIFVLFFTLFSECFGTFLRVIIVCGSFFLMMKVVKVQLLSDINCNKTLTWLRIGSVFTAFLEERKIEKWNYLKEKWNAKHDSSY